MDVNLTGPYRGQCLCGGVQYEVVQIGAKMGHCHCTMCRKFHGAAFATYGEARAEDFRWLAGEEWTAAVCRRAAKSSPEIGRPCKNATGLPITDKKRKWN